MLTHLLAAGVAVAAPGPPTELRVGAYVPSGIRPGAQVSAMWRFGKEERRPWAVGPTAGAYLHPQVHAAWFVGARGAWQSGRPDRLGVRISAVSAFQYAHLLGTVYTDGARVVGAAGQPMWTNSLTFGLRGPTAAGSWALAVGAVGRAPINGVVHLHPLLEFDLAFERRS